MKAVLLAVAVLFAAAFTLGPDIGGGIVRPEGIPTATGISGPDIGIIGGYPMLFPSGACPSCSVFTDRPFIASSINEDEKTIYSSMGVITPSGVSPVEDATLFVYLVKPDGTVSKRCRAYTSDKGEISYSYGSLCDDGCTIKVLFCCSDPVELACVLSSCLGEPIGSHLEFPPCDGYDAGGWPEKAVVGGQAMQLYPTVDEVFIPPRLVPEGLGFTFTLCFPVLAIFGLLGAAMYASGRDPFAMFSFYTPRFTRGAEKPIAGKGYTLPGSSLGMLATRVADLAKDAGGTAQQFVDMMKKSPLLEKTSGRVGMAAGSGRGSAGQDQGMTAGEARAMGMPVVGGFGSGAPQSVMRGSGDAVGVGVGTAFMALLGIFLRFSNAPWLTGGLATAVNGLVSEWQAERLAGFAGTAEKIMETMKPTFNQRGELVRIEYTDPETGERVTISGKEKCAEFVRLNLVEPTMAMYSANAEKAIGMMAQLNELTVAQSPVRGCRDMLAAESGREGISEEAKAALRIISDSNATNAQRRDAFEALAGMDWSGRPDVLLNALAAVGAGMSYSQFSHFLQGSEAAMDVFRNLAADAAALKGSGDGNMLAAMSAAAGVLSMLNAGRPEGVSDTRGIAQVVAAIREGVANCGGESFAFRAGTEIVAANMAGMGLSTAALGVAIDVSGLNLTNVPPQVRAEIEKALEDGRVTVAELGNEAREAIVQIATSQLGDGAARGFSEAFGDYDQLSRQSYGIMRREMDGVFEQAREASGVSGVLGPDGELAGENRPYGLDSDKALALLGQNNIDAGIARAMVEFGLLDERREYAGNLLGIARMLEEPRPEERISAMAANNESRASGMEAHAASIDNAMAILGSPLSSEASRAWAERYLGSELQGEFYRARQTLSNPNASEDDLARARRAMELIGNGDIAGYSRLVLDDSERIRAEQPRLDAARDLLTNPTQDNALAYSQNAGQSTPADRLAPLPEQVVERLTGDTQMQIYFERRDAFNPDRPGGGITGSLMDERLRSEEATFRSKELQVALLGNRAIDDFYANMDRNMEIAREVQERIDAESRRRRAAESAGSPEGGAASESRDQGEGRGPPAP